MPTNTDLGFSHTERLIAHFRGVAVQMQHKQHPGTLELHLSLSGDLLGKRQSKKDILTRTKAQTCGTRAEDGLMART